MSKKTITLITSLVGALLLSTLVYRRVIKHTSGPMNISAGEYEEEIELM